MVWVCAGLYRCGADEHRYRTEKYQESSHQNMLVGDAFAFEEATQPGRSLLRLSSVGHLGCLGS